MLETVHYAWDPLAAAYFAAALTVFGSGGGTLLFERFTEASRRFFVVTLLCAGWVTTLGLALLSADPATTAFWLRATWAIDPFTAASLFWVVQALVGVRRIRVQRAAWVVALAFGATSALTPALVEGQESLTRDHALTGHGWLGGLYLLYIAAMVALSIHELVLSRRRAGARTDRLERGALLVAAAIGSLTLLDYWLPGALVRAGPLTPPSLIAAALISGWTAVRYRVFSVAHTFGTDEIMRAMSDAVLVCDEAGRIRGANRGARSLLGCEERELIGMPAGRFFRADGRGWRPVPDDLVRDRKLRVHSARGELVDVSVSTEPLAVRGRTIGTVIVARDIRERLAAERALEAARLRYDALFVHNPGLAYEIDLEGRFINANDTLAGVLGHDLSELRGRPFSQFLDPSTQAEAAAVFRAALQGEPHQYELTILDFRGEPVMLRGVTIPIMEDGELVGVGGVALDVTGEHRALQEVEVQRQYFAALFESSPEAIVIVDADDRILRVNGEFGRLFGYAASEVVGERLDELIVPESGRGEATRLIVEAVAGGLAQTETVRQRRDGSAVEVSILARRLDVPGESAHLYGIYRDIGDRKAAERALREREEELRHAQRLESVGKLAGGIAHDFNNLMTVINGHAGLALQELDREDPVWSSLQEIERAGQRAASLTEQLLAFSRRQVLRPRVLALNSVVGETDRMLGRVIGEHIRLETQLDDAAHNVRVDRGQLEQVLINLVMNARDAMVEGGRLTIRTDSLLIGEAEIPAGWKISPGPYARLIVEDSGPGMDAEILSQVFDPFFTTKEQGKGTGLGLSTAFGIVKQSGGHITAESEPGRGSRFTVYLPAVDAAEAGPTEPAERRHAPPRPPCKGTILVVEDEQGVRRLAARILERAGYRVFTAANGRDALDMLETGDRRIDAVLTDLVMPEMGGRELRRRIRRRSPDLEFVFMSGYDAEGSEAPPGDHPGFDTDPFLAKPFTPAALLDAVEAAIGGPVADAPVPAAPAQAAGECPR